MLPLSTWRHWKLSKMPRRWLRPRVAAAISREVQAGSMAAMAAAVMVMAAALMAEVQAAHQAVPMPVVAVMAATAAIIRCR